MSGRDIGVFLSARHFERIAPADRTPDEVLDNVERAANRLLLASGIAHRIVVADCARSAERAVADQLALEAGFRVRHCPAAGPDQSMVLTAELLEALTASPWLRTFVIGDVLAAQSTAIDVLHRQDKSVIGLVSEYPAPPRLTDMTYTLPLATPGLLKLVNSILDRITEAGGQASPAEVYRRLQLEIADFSPRTYGFGAMADLIEAARAGRTATPPRTRTIGPAKPAKKTTKNDKTDQSKKASPQTAVRVAINSLPRMATDELAEMDDVQLGCHVLEALITRPELIDPLRTGNLPVHLFAQALKQVTGNPNWRPSGAPSFFELMRQATTAQGGWILASSPGNTNYGVFLRATQLPTGWELFAPSQRHDDETAAAVESSAAKDEVTPSDPGAPLGAGTDTTTDSSGAEPLDGADAWQCHSDDQDLLRQIPPNSSGHPD